MKRKRGEGIKLYNKKEGMGRNGQSKKTIGLRNGEEGTIKEIKLKGKWEKEWVELSTL